MNNETNEVFNPFTNGESGFSWFFEQALYYSYGIARALKSESGSGNIPKVIVDIRK